MARASDKRLEGKKILITGAGSGIGRQAAIHLADEGAEPVLADIDARKLEETAALLPQKVTAVSLDVTSEDDWVKCVDTVRDRFSQIDGLVNCAGVALPNDDIERCSPEMFSRVMQINVTGTFLGCRAVLPVMKDSGGSIVNVGSIRSLVASAETLSYTTSKTAVLGLTRSVALFCASMNIRVNVICPGAIETEMQTAWLNAMPDPGAARRSMESEYPVGRLGEPAEIAAAISFLLSDESRFMTGAHLVIDGGFTAR